MGKYLAEKLTDEVDRIVKKSERLKVRSRNTHIAVSKEEAISANVAFNRFSSQLMNGNQVNF